jgi:fatty-acyl-CoA synthase
MVIRMLDDPSLARRDTRTWRLALIGGAPVAPELVRRAAQLVPGLKVAIGFGQTEASPYLTHTLPDDPHPDWIATVGRPMPQTEVRIVDPESGNTAPLDAIGEICARGYGVMKDYFDNPDATHAGQNGIKRVHVIHRMEISSGYRLISRESAREECR